MKSLIYSTRKAFLERAVVVNLTRSLSQVKVSRPLKCHSNFGGGGGHIHINGHHATPITYPPVRACTCGVIK